MISLSRHIELLLLEHNCVIVPGLGGFIANTACATYNDGPYGDKLFIPPYRTIAFNPQLQVNDGLLVQSYMQAYDAAYPSAYLQMEKEIEQLNIQLNLFGEYHIEGVGTLRKSLGQGIVLTSSEAGILTPSLYGTYSFAVKSLAEVVKERERQSIADQTNIMPIQTEIDLRIKEKEEEKKDKVSQPVIPIKRTKGKKTARRRRTYWAEFGAAAAVAAIIFLICLIPNISNMNGVKETVIAGAPGFEIEANKPAVDHSTNTTPSVSTSHTPTSASTQANTENNANVNSNAHSQMQPVPKPEVNKPYTLVLASFVTEKNSNILIQQLASVGLAEGRFVTNGKTNRVIYSSYATEEEAITALRSLREQNEAFKDAWTMKME